MVSIFIITEQNTLDTYSWTKSKLIFIRILIILTEFYISLQQYFEINS